MWYTYSKYRPKATLAPPASPLKFWKLWSPKDDPGIPKSPYIPFESVTKILLETSHFLWGKSIFHLQVGVQHCEEQHGNTACAFASLYGSIVTWLPQKGLVARSDLNPFPPSLIAQRPNADGMLPPVLQAWQPVHRSFEAKAQKWNVETGRRLVLDREKCWDIGSVQSIINMLSQPLDKWGKHEVYNFQQSGMTKHDGSVIQSGSTECNHCIRGSYTPGCSLSKSQLTGCWSRIGSKFLSKEMGVVTTKWHIVWGSYISWLWLKKHDQTIDFWARFSKMSTILETHGLWSTLTDLPLDGGVDEDPRLPILPASTWSRLDVPKWLYK